MPPRAPISRPFLLHNIDFRPEFIDFRRGIRVGNLNDNERISRILKLALESKYRQPFVTEKWGRGVYWQWIGYLVKANRTVKPISSNISFGCSKFFILMDTEEQSFKCGLQVERGFIRAPIGYAKFKLCDDWDWYQLLRALKPKGPMERELKRLVMREGFLLQAGSWHSTTTLFRKTNFPSMSHLRATLTKAPVSRWAGLMIYFSMNEEEVQSTCGVDLVESMLAIFQELTPTMRLCIQTPL